MVRQMSLTPMTWENDDESTEGTIHLKHGGLSYHQIWVFPTSFDSGLGASSSSS